VGPPEGYYGEVREGSMIPEGQPNSATNAHRLWTGAKR
jgi:hypothetical protein